VEIILGSQSPRRKELLSSLGYNFKVEVAAIEEDYPSDLPLEEVALYIAKAKSAALLPAIKKNQLLICADTIVIQEGVILGKPKDASQAKEMLQYLSGKTHKVITAYCIVKDGIYYTDSIETLVTFKVLSEGEILYYLENGNPYDKAGGYGIQDWIGCVAVSKIVGSYTNVMGFPTVEIFEQLKKLGA
jgi:septum formation protein